MSIEKLKEQARRHEQKEEWQKALDQYKKAIRRLAEDDQPDIGLYNRVGDLFVRIGELAHAVEHYQQAVDLYLEAELPNNAIAVCKKVIRNVPDRHATYLRMGQIRAQQGFIPDARTNFLTYAERLAQAGDMEESLRALSEFTELAPEDVEVRLFLAEQLATYDREEDAVRHLVHAYQVLEAEGEPGEAASVRARIEELDSLADLTAAPSPPLSVATDPEDSGEMVLETGAGFVAGDEIGGELGEITHPGEGEEGAGEAREDEERDAGGMQARDEDESDASATEDFVAESIELETAYEEAASEEAEYESDEGEEEWADEDGELPLMHFEGEEEEPDELSFMDVDAIEDADGGEGLEDLPLLEPEGDEGEEVEDVRSMELDADEDEREADELPLMEFDADEDGEEAEDLPLLEVDSEEEGGDATEGPEAARSVEEAVEEAVSAASTDLTFEEIRTRLEDDPDDIPLHQRMVELAYGTAREEDLVEAYLGLARALDRQEEPVRARVAYQQVLDLDAANDEAREALAGEGAPPAPVKEVAAHEDYVDLGAMILGDEEEKTTRFVVAYEEPTGDEEADFAKMLSQFKSKVSENLGADDVRAHHDLGTAYKEMGLLDEAVAEFQQALRADASHLPTYELMGQVFMEMGKADQAIRSLERALKAPFEVEDELVGIYYYLARAYETEGNTGKALEFYDRVFSLDINFADVTERLRALRPA